MNTNPEYNRAEVAEALLAWIATPAGQAWLSSSEDDDVVVVEPSPGEARSNVAFAWGWVAGFLVAVLLAWMFILASDQAIPPCTDRIAESGGICQGPLVDESLAIIPAPVTR